MLKLLLMQTFRKGAETYIADSSKVCHEKSRMYFAEKDLRDALDRLVAELEYRKSTFKASGCQKYRRLQ